MNPEHDDECPETLRMPPRGDLLAECVNEEDIEECPPTEPQSRR